MKKILLCFILTIFIISCSKKTTISEDFYYSVDDKQNTNTVKNNNKSNVQKNKSEIDNSKIKQIIDYSKKFLGTPYKYGGTTPQGFDCSGFIIYVFKNSGIELNGNAINLSEQCKKITKTEIRAGDLVFFKGSNINNNNIGHIALVIETSGNDFKMIHATTSKGVVINDFGQYEYWKSRFLFAGRILVN